MLYMTSAPLSISPSPAFLTASAVNTNSFFDNLAGTSLAIARELQPKNIHVAHFVIDGGISSKTRPDNGEDRLLDPDEIAKTYLNFHRQNRSAWSWEIELRP